MHLDSRKEQHAALEQQLGSLEDPAPYIPLHESPPLPNRCRRALVCAAAAAAVSATAGLAWLAGVAPAAATAWLPLTLDKDNHKSIDIAYLVFVRHGEKQQNGPGLTEVGAHRAEYIAKCFSNDDPSLALPFGKPKMLAACSNTKESHRPRDTLMPLSKKLKVKLDQSIHKDDAKGLASFVQKKLEPKSTLVVAWHHGSIPEIIKELLGEKEWLAKWPEKCEPPEGDEPKHLKGDSICYDLLWRVTMVRHEHSKNVPKEWKVLGLTSTMQGFSGDHDGPCLWGTKSLKAGRWDARRRRSNVKDAPSIEAAASDSLPFVL